MTSLATLGMVDKLRVADVLFAVVFDADDKPINSFEPVGLSNLNEFVYLTISPFLVMLLQNVNNWAGNISFYHFALGLQVINLNLYFCSW